MSKTLTEFEENQKVSQQRRLNYYSSKLFFNSSDVSLKKKVDWSYHNKIFTLLSGELFKVLKCLNLTNKVKLDLIKTYSSYLLNLQYYNTKGKLVT